MTVYPGIDTYSFPGSDTLAWFKANSTLVWTGLYLTHGPGNRDESWVGAYASIAPTWGVAPLYVGRQQPDAGDVDERNAANGTIDGNEAAQIAGDTQIPAGLVLYLDIETGGAQPKNALDYFNAWVAAVKAKGYMPGVYCSHTTSAQLVGEQPGIVLWNFKLTVANGSTLGPIFEGDPKAPKAPYDGARMQQYAQNCFTVSGADGQKLKADFSIGSVYDPSKP